MPSLGDWLGTQACQSDSLTASCQEFSLFYAMKGIHCEINRTNSKSNTSSSTMPTGVGSPDVVYLCLHPQKRPPHCSPEPERTCRQIWDFQDHQQCKNHWLCLTVTKQHKLGLLPKDSASLQPQTQSHFQVKTETMSALQLSGRLLMM